MKNSTQYFFICFKSLSSAYERRSERERAVSDTLWTGSSFTLFTTFRVYYRSFLHWIWVWATEWSQHRYKVDGDCIEQCDCGPTNPCGEYIFDHRGGEVEGRTFRDWFINELVNVLFFPINSFLYCNTIYFHIEFMWNRLHNFFSLSAYYQ